MERDDFKELSRICLSCDAAQIWRNATKVEMVFGFQKILRGFFQFWSFLVSDMVWKPKKSDQKSAKIVFRVFTSLLHRVQPSKKDQN